MFLGLDLGTSNVKVLITDRNGRVASRSSATVERRIVGADGVEQDIEQIWDAACRAIRGAIVQIDPSKIQAVGVSSQGGAVQLLDAQGAPLGPVISWLDRRGRPFNQRIEQQWGQTYLVDHTGSNLSTTTLGQVLRLHEESPETLRAAKGIGYVGDIIVGRLSGRRAHDATSLSLAMLYNPRLGGADHGLLVRLGIHDKELPHLLSAREPAGPLTESVACQTGLPAGIPVSPAVHDQYAAAIGAGAVCDGDVMAGAGTAWVILGVTNRLRPPVAPRTFVCSHPAPGLYGQLFAMGSAGAALQWALDLADSRAPSRATLDERIEDVPPGTNGLCFRLPATNAGPGEVVLPSGGAFSEDPAAQQPDCVLRAVVEGLAHELARNLLQLSRNGLSVRRLLLSGPAANSRVVAQIIANVVNRPVLCHKETAMSALGATVLARSLVDRNADLPSLTSKVISEHRTLTPNADASLYQQSFQEYLDWFKQHDREESAG